MLLATKPHTLKHYCCVDSPNAFVGAVNFFFPLVFPFGFRFFVLLVYTQNKYISQMCSWGCECNSQAEVDAVLAIKSNDVDVEQSQKTNTNTFSSGTPVIPKILTDILGVSRATNIYSLSRICDSIVVQAVYESRPLPKFFPRVSVSISDKMD